MNTLPKFFSLLRARLGLIVRSLQASMRTRVPRPAPALVPIRVDRRRQDAIQRRRHRGF